MNANGDGGQPQNAKDGDAAPTAAQSSAPITAAPPRPWLVPAVASAVAAVVFGFLLIPGVLRYPEQARPPTPTPPNPDAIVAQRESNRALEERIASLRRLLDGGVCVAEGAYRTLDRPGSAPVTPQDRAALPAPPLAATPVPTDAAAPGTPFSGSLLDLIDQATVLVLAAKADGDIVGSGSGFLVAPGMVLTNRHVIGDVPGGKFHVVGRGVGVRPADVVASTADASPGAPDFAVLRLQGAAPAQAAVPLTFAPPAERLEGVVAAGYPGLVLQTDQRFQTLLEGRGGEVPTAAVTEGVVTAVQAGEGAGVILHTAQITPGNSGGPLVDRCGRVVGINTFILAEKEGRMNYALAGADARRFLAANNIQARAASERCAPPAAAQSAAPAPAAPTPPTAAAPGAPAPGAPATGATPPGGGTGGKPPATR